MIFDIDDKLLKGHWYVLIPFGRKKYAMNALKDLGYSCMVKKIIDIKTKR